MTWHNGLTERRRKFCEAYAANGGNATKAAELAGFRKPEPEGSRLLRNAKVLSALEALREGMTTDAIANREERQSFWTALMRDPNEQTKDRLKASELLGKSQADFIERKEISGPQGEPLTLADFYGGMGAVSLNLDCENTFIEAE